MVNKRKKIIRFFLVFLMFIISLYLRIWNLNQMGRTWDEAFYVDQGSRLIGAMIKGDFADKVWYREPDPPALSKYIYGLANNLNIGKIIPCNEELCSYDFTSARLMSVLFSSLTVLLVVFIGWEYISFFVGIIAGIILASLPVLLGLSQLVTIESTLIFFFTASVYSFLHLLKTSSIKNIIMCGILLGLAIGTKYTNIILIPLLFLIYLIWNSKKNKKKIGIFDKKLLLIIPIAFLTFFLIWPIPWLHMSEVWEWERSVRFSNVANHPVPEVFFGRLMPVPIFYYLVYFLITTPFLILLFFLYGLKKISMEKTWIFYSIAVWFALPFGQSFLSMRQHGIRYIIEIYVPLSLITAIGIDFLVKKYVKVRCGTMLIVTFLAIYMLIILYRITPYYLDYFNILVGGAKSVYESKSFQLGWWGQGVRGAAVYINNNARPGSTIGIAISPPTVMPALSKFSVSKYNPEVKYDYVIVNYYNILREGFDDKEIKNNYLPVYSENADGAKLVIVYKRK